MKDYIYPFYKLHDNRVHSPFNVMVVIRCEGPIIWVVFDERFGLGSHDEVDVEVDGLLNKQTEYLYKL